MTKMLKHASRFAGQIKSESTHTHTHEPRLLALVTRLDLLCPPHHFPTSPWCTAASPCRNQISCRPFFFVFHLYCLCSLWRIDKRSCYCFFESHRNICWFSCGRSCSMGWASTSRFYAHLPDDNVRQNR